MKQKKRRSARTLLLLVLLAAVCIGGAELAVCRVADRPLYDRITAPARAFSENLGREVRTLAAAVRQANRVRAEQRSLEEARRLAAEQAESQRAGEAAVQATYVPADPAITQLVTLHDREYLLGGNLELAYFNQSDAQWADRPFGVDPIGEYGCGPTALSMLVSSMTGETVDPEELAAWAAENGYAAPGSGSFHSIVEGAAAHYGLNCVSLAGVDADTLCQQLVLSGGIVVALMGPGHFTRGGHFILLHGVTLGGEVLVADPYSREKSLTTWDPQLILDELSVSRDSGAPLWLVTPAGVPVTFLREPEDVSDAGGAPAPGAAG